MPDGWLTEGCPTGNHQAGLPGPERQYLAAAYTAIYHRVRDSVIQLYFKCWFLVPQELQE